MEHSCFAKTIVVATRFLKSEIRDQPEAAKPDLLPEIITPMMLGQPHVETARQNDFPRFPICHLQKNDIEDTDKLLRHLLPL